MNSKSKFRVLIVDDEELARSVLREYCSARTDVTVVGECANGFEALKSVSELKPDVILLDIQMPKLSGFEVLELLEDPPQIIFVTAFDKFAVKAFEVNAVDYVLKPVRKERLFEALDRLKRTSASARAEQSAAIVSAVREQNKPLERILIRDGAHVHVVPVDTVDYIQAQDDYVEIKTPQKKYLKQDRLSLLAESLDQRKFIRIHRSFILNLDRLAKIEPLGKDSHVAVLKDGSRLALSKSGYKLLKQLL